MNDGEILDIVKEKKRIIWMPMVGYINEERIKEMKTTNEVGLVMVSHTTSTWILGIIDTQPCTKLTAVKIRIYDDC